MRDKVQRKKEESNSQRSRNVRISRGDFSDKRGFFICGYLTFYRWSETCLLKIPDFLGLRVPTWQFFLFHSQRLDKNTTWYFFLCFFVSNANEEFVFSWFLLCVICYFFCCLKCTTVRMYVSSSRDNLHEKFFFFALRIIFCIDRRSGKVVHNS